MSAYRLEPTSLLGALVLMASLVLGCDVEGAETPPPVHRAEAKNGRTSVHLPAKLTSVPSGKRDAMGREIRVSCESCHSLLPEDREMATSMTELEEFHSGLVFAHGDLSCASCHASTSERRLRLASGETLPMTEALRLCGQCHGPQYRDFEAGVHGGMSGHWDLSRGGRIRNHCVDCHDPHVPAYPQLMPAPPPGDVPAPPRTPHRTTEGKPLVFVPSGQHDTRRVDRW